MSTRSRIGFCEKGVVKSVYCHSDGYPEYNGKLLLEHYNSLEKAKALVSLGSISSLGETLDYRDDEHPNGTRDYYRWRGEPLTISTAEGISDYADRGFDSDEEYLYLFLNGEWYVLYGSRASSWDRLEDLLSSEKKKKCRDGIDYMLQFLREKIEGHDMADSITVDAWSLQTMIWLLTDIKKEEDEK